MARLARSRGIVGGLLLCVLLLPGIVWAAQGEAAVGGVRLFFGLSPRATIWAVAQLHLLFAAFVLGVPVFAVIVEFIGWAYGGTSATIAWPGNSSNF